MVSIYKICGAAIISVVLSVVLKHRSSSVAPYLTEITAILITSSTITALFPLISFVKELISDGGIKYDVLETLIKAAVTAIVCQVVYDLCKENGENMLATAVEFAGNAEIILLSLPLLSGLIIDTFEMLSI